jgi:3-hydroxyacyl-CoA dehydrogenase
MAANGKEVIANIAVVSIGEMGAGVASLLHASGFGVYSNCKGRRYHPVISMVAERKVLED